MHNIIKILGGIGILIAIYLFLSRGDQTTKIINSISGNLIDGITVLQGKNIIKTE